MKNKIIAITLILALLINITIIKKEYYAAAPLLLAPAAKYLIGGTIAAAGLYAATDEDLQYVIWDYYNKAADNIKLRWYNAALMGGTVGKALIENTLISDITNYLNANYTTGENIIEKTPEKVKDCFNLPDNTIWAKSFITFSNGAEFIIYITINENGNKSIKEYIAGQDGYIYLRTHLGYPTRDNMNNLPTYVSRIENGKIYYYRDYYHKTGIKYGETYDGVTIPVALRDEIVYSTIGLEAYNFAGSFSGFGTAINNSVTQNQRPLEIPVPPVPPDTWDDTWLNDLEKELNSLDNPFLDDQTLIEEWNSTDYDWYVDKDGNLYKKPKGEPPKKEDDTKLIPFPHIPDFPEIPDIPEIPEIEPCPYCPTNPYSPSNPTGEPCPNPYCPNQPNPVTPPIPSPTGEPVTPCPYCPPNPYSPSNPTGEPCPNPYCPNQPNPVTPPVPSTPPVLDDTEIDWRPLLQLPNLLTNKFPFSLPWDILRGVESLESQEWDRKIIINVGDGIWPPMEIDLSIFDNIARITRIVLLLVFDFALIFSTRKLMGGDV